jgi:hypothetical protein
MGRIATLDPFEYEYEYRVAEYEYENIRRLGRRVLMC